MALSPLSSHDTALRDEVDELDDGRAPRAAMDSIHLPPRSTSHAEEGVGGRNEWWSLAKAVAIGAVVIMLIGWLISA